MEVKIMSDFPMNKGLGMVGYLSVSTI